MTSSDLPRGRHRLVEPGCRPALLPRSLTVVAATVGTVLALNAQDRVDLPAARPHADGPARVMSALEPVIPAPRPGAPAPVHRTPVGVTGGAIAEAHTSGAASMRVVAARNLFVA